MFCQGSWYSYILKYFWSYVELTRTQLQYIWSSLLLLCAHFIPVFLKTVPLLTSPRPYMSSSTLQFITFFTLVLFWTSYSAICIQIIFYDAETHFCNFSVFCHLSSRFFLCLCGWTYTRVCISVLIYVLHLSLFFKDNILEIILMRNIFSILTRLGCFLRFTLTHVKRKYYFFPRSIFCFKCAFIQAYRAYSCIGRKTGQGKAILNGANIMEELVVVFCEMWRENWRKQEYNMSERSEYIAAAVV